MRAALVNFAYRYGDPLGNRFLSPPRRGFGYFVHHGPRTERRVALTFDDGPSRPATEELLDALGELDAKATFFCVGVNVALNPDLARRIDAEGHVVGSHSYRHSRGAGLSLRDTAHIEDAERENVRVLGKAPRLYRPPWGWLTPWEGRRLRDRGYTAIGWDVYTLDWKIPEPDAGDVARAAIADTRPGSIICMHDAFPLHEEWTKRVTVEAVRQIVPALRADGYEFVTVADLLDVPAYSNDPAVALGR